MKHLFPSLLQFLKHDLLPYILSDVNMEKGYAVSMKELKSFRDLRFFGPTFPPKNEKEERRSRRSLS